MTESRHLLQTLAGSVYTKAEINANIYTRAEADARFYTKAQVRATGPSHAGCASMRLSCATARTPPCPTTTIVCAACGLG